MPALGWTVLIPVKASGRGKSRILLDPARRQELALAMAMDTAAAAAAAPPVRAVVAVAEDAADAEALGAIVGVVARLTSVRGLNSSIMDAVRDLAGPVAVLPGDLPSLLPAELALALGFAGPHRLAVVADRQGSGTTLLAASGARQLRPRYGPGSFAAHLTAGAVHVPTAPSSGLRRDVDVLEDLLADFASGAAIGPLTKQVAARVGDLMNAGPNPSGQAGGTVES